MEITSDMLGPFAEYLGLHLESASGDEVVATWSARPDLHQPYGIVHGGVHAAVVETLASVPFVVRGGSAWFKEFGPEKSPGPKIYSLSGRVVHPASTRPPWGRRCASCSRWPAASAPATS